ncbi:hypothetical protein OY671_008196, partial [Metschnikowia pulcherrima]
MKNIAINPGAGMVGGNAAHAGADEHKGAKKAVIAASIGNASEWYDFSVYASFAVYIGQNFFHNADPTVQSMASFSAFGSGFVVRPSGASMSGAYGDRAGRKAASTSTIMSMASGTSLIAIAPPYAAIGVGAPSSIVCGRMSQGFSAGGEVGGATAFSVEHAPAGKRGQYASWSQGSMGISNSSGASVATSVTTSSTEDQVGEWGWRIPFSAAASSVGSGSWVRSRIGETAAFRAAVEAAPPPRVPIGRSFADHAGAVIAGIAGVVACFAIFYLATTFASSFGTKTLGYSREAFS